MIEKGWILLLFYPMYEDGYFNDMRNCLHLLLFGIKNLLKPYVPTPWSHREYNDSVMDRQRNI